MSYINFDKLQLINLEYALSKELLRSNRAGSYSNTTIIGCNTRKYHGLLITRQPHIDGEHHVLLSTVDETVIQNDASFNFGIHKFKGGHYNPRGHKYIRDFVTEPIPKITFRVGGVFLTKEMLYTHDDDRVIIKYTLQDAHSQTLLRLKPFLAYRNFHSLSKANHFADTHYDPIRNGIQMCLYPGYSPLCIQISKKNEYVHLPDWYYNIEYQEEIERGYEALEDLLVPGYFEFEMKKGESVYFSAGLDEVDPSSLQKLYDREVDRRIPRDNFKNCLLNSAHQFITQNKDKYEVVAGFPWYGRHGRDTFIALPGLTLVDMRLDSFFGVLDTMVSEMEGPFFPEYGRGNKAFYGQVDTPLWFFWAIQQYVEVSGDKTGAWKKYSKPLLTILNAYRKGAGENIHMQANGLIYAGDSDKALTWMDAFIDGRPVTPRQGCPVEVNALWYNAICFVIDLARNSGEKEIAKEWEPLAQLVARSFEQVFWDEAKSFLADVADGEAKDWSVRPNMLLAVALPFCPIDEEKQKLVLDKVRSELLTPRGIRSLSPKDPNYHGLYIGDQKERDEAVHQGTVWPWLLSFFVSAHLKIHEKSGISLIQKIFNDFEPVVKEHAIGSISELYDGDPPHHFGGACSMAWSVASLLWTSRVLSKFVNNKN